MLATYLLLTITTMAGVEAYLAPVERAVAPVAIAATGLLAAWLPARFLDHRPLRSLGLAGDRRWWRDLGLGLLLGLFLTGGVCAIYLGMGWARVTGWMVAEEDTSFATGFTALVALYLAVAFLEELLFRGYFITNATEGFRAPVLRRLARWLPERWQGAVPVPLAIVVSSGLFAHFHGDSLTGLDYVHFGLAGVLLAVPYVYTGQLALSLGLHITFNLGVTGLFNVEGGLPALLRLEVDGPPLWAGEAAMVETVMLAVTLLVTVGLLRHHGRAGLDDAFRAEERTPETAS